MKGQEKLCAKLWSAFLRKWWFMIGLAVVLVLLGVIVLIFFMAWINAFIDMEIVLKPSSQTYKFWSKPPIEPYLHVYIYNVTNADEFLNNGSKPSVEELGPYVYRQNWEKMNITFNENGTVSFNPSKIYTFDEEASYGSVDDVVVVPNIPMLSATSQSKHAARFLRLAMASIMDILKIKPFVEVSVDQLLWGYEDPLLRLAKDVTKDAKLPYEEFGLFYKKNGTSEDRITVFTGASDITKFGLIDKFNGRAYLPHWKTDSCNRLNGSDGSLFPPHISKDDMIYIYDKDLCRLLPLKYEKDIVAQGNVSGYRFTPPENIFASVENNPDNECFCPGGPPCAPNGLFNVSLCQYDSPVLLSFPHFYMADDSFREAFDGISPPDPEKHKLYVDVSPVMGTALAARARVQINLAVSQVIDIKQVANFPDIVFPIMWFEEGVVGLPEEATKLMKLASDVPPVARSIVSAALFIVGIILLIVATWRLIKAAHAHSTLHLNTPIYGKDVKRENNVPLSNIMK